MLKRGRWWPHEKAAAFPHSQPGALGGRFFSGGGWGTANKPTLLCGRLDRAPQTLTTQGPYKDTKTDLTSDATGSC